MCALWMVAGVAVLFAATSAPAAEGEPVGPPFFANTIQTSSQGKSGGVATAALGDGGFIVVWDDYYPVATVVAGQRFDAQGSSVGTEFSVTPPSRYGGYKDVGAAGLADGGFIVVWDEDGAPGGDQRDVSAQLYDSTGTPVGSPFLANTTTAEDQGEQLDVEGLDDGSFVVVWVDTYPDANVRGQLFSSSGTSIGTEFIVNTATAGSQGYAAVALTKLEGGGFVVAWSDDSAPGGDNYDVSVQQFDSAGAKVGSQFLANAATTGFQGKLESRRRGTRGWGIRSCLEHRFHRAFGGRCRRTTFRQQRGGRRKRACRQQRPARRARLPFARRGAAPRRRLRHRLE
jgi:hypothetical protein